MKGNFRNSYMNDAGIENVSGGMSTTKKVIIGVAALAGTVALAYGGKTVYNVAGDTGRGANPLTGKYYGFGKYNPPNPGDNQDKEAPAKS